MQPLQGVSRIIVAVDLCVVSRVGFSRRSFIRYDSRILERRCYESKRTGVCDERKVQRQIPLDGKNAIARDADEFRLSMLRENTARHCAAIAVDITDAPAVIRDRVN